MTTWGLVSTVKAPLSEVLDFAAWHLDQGAAQLYLYLDDDAPDTRAALNAHPRITALHTDAAWWAKRNGKPDAHQTRQSLNARHANNRRAAVDWLAHIDVDEFLISDRPIAEHLSALPPQTLCARVRPIEALAPATNTDTGPDIAFKAFHLDQTARQAAARRCFPTWGAQLSGGFLSHVAGKLFFRTGLKGLQIKIHNVILDGVQNPGQVELPQIALGHMHAKSWEQFVSAYRFRLAHGSYRAALKPQVRQDGARNLHDLFRQIESSGGLPALRAFYDEVCTATPTLCQRLEAEGLLRRHRLDLIAARARHFPQHTN